MAARKKATRRKSARARAKQTLSRLERELPPTLREYAKEVRSLLNRLEKEVERASVPYRRRAARLLREASHQLGRLEVRGEAGWRRRAAPYRRDTQRLLRRLEKAVAPRSARKKKKVTRRPRSKAGVSPKPVRPVPTATESSGGASA